MIYAKFSKLSVVWLLLANCLFAQNAADIRLERFKGRIGYVERLRGAANYGDLVISGVPDMSVCPIISDGFQMDDESIYTISHGIGIEKRIRYRKNREIVDIDFFYFPNSYQNAENLFWGIPSSVNTGEIPGTRGPSDLGDFSIELPNPYGAMILFLKENVCTQITARDSSYNILNIARWVQSQFKLRAWREVQNNLPRPTRETIGRLNVRQGQALLDAKAQPLHARVGEAIEVNVEVPSGSNTSHYLIRPEFDHQRFRSTMANNILTIIPTQAGQGSFRYVIIDKKTLLFSTYEIPVDVQP